VSARPRLATALEIAAPIVAVGLALAAGGAFILAAGEDPFAIYALIFRQCFGTGYGLGQTLFKATPLIFTGLAVAIGFRGGLFNIGVEGQLYLGGLAAALAAVALAHTPAPVPLLGALVAAALAGAGWGAIPGVLKARFGAHEVINTIMMNFVAFSLVAFVGRRVFEIATVRTLQIPAAAELPRFDVWLPALRGSPANVALILAVLLALAVGYLMFRTRFGYAIRAVGFNPGAAEYGGIAIGRTQTITLAISGAVAGLGGVNFVLGYKHFFELGFSAGAGFLGIAVALIGRNHPLGVIVAALFFGALSYGGLVINQRVPKELVEMLTALVILFAIAVQQVMERAARSLR
jgi:simple sugar transport system permease protein